MTDATHGVIERYFRAVADDDTDALVACFADDAAVADEGKTYRGHDQIRGWREQTRAAYQYTAEMLRTEPRDDDRYAVTTKLTGNFPGSPVEVQYLFALRGDLIAGLDIE
jgi:ketosteroid isomerase-like protein